MGIFTKTTNSIKCGKCGTVFDLNLNKNGCPLCRFGKKQESNNCEFVENGREKLSGSLTQFITIPPKIDLDKGKVNSSDETQVWGSWLMFNDFFAPKFLARITAWKIFSQNKDYIRLDLLMEESCKIIESFNLNSLKGFPREIKNQDIQKDSAVGRLVNHFLRTSTDMGLFNVREVKNPTKDIWREDWENIEVTLTEKGLEFARLENNMFDGVGKDQKLTKKEKEWLVEYLKQIDKKGYKEYTILKEIFNFLKEGDKGPHELRDWFKSKDKFRDYIKRRSKKARENDKVFHRQLDNYAKSFSSAKVSLLREMGVVKDKRNDYGIIGDLE